MVVEKHEKRIMSCTVKTRFTPIDKDKGFEVDFDVYGDDECKKLMKRLRENA